MIIIREKM